MKKIRLDVDALRVESFGTTKEEGARGTVLAHSGWSACPTGCGEWTCLNYGSCDPYMECLHTGDLPTCGAAGC
jgi:hypothetical protein